MGRRYFYILIILTIVLVFAVSPVVKVQTKEELQKEVKQQLSNTPLEIKGEKLHAQNILIEHYRENNFGFHWTTSEKLLPQAEQFLKELKKSKESGLEPEDYNISLINKLIKENNGKYNLETLSKIELLLTNSFLIYISDVHRGKYDYSSNDRIWVQPSKEIDYIDILNKVDQSNILDLIETVKPEFSEYDNLKNALDKYRNLKKNRNWDKLNKKHDIEAGKEKEKVAEIIARIKLNMDRLRWAGIEPDSDFILINLPEYKLEVWEKNNIINEINIVIGEPESPTPVFSEKINRIILNPVWRIPRSVIFDDFLPEVKKEVSYLKRNFIKVYKRNSNNEYKEINPKEIDWDQVTEENFDFHFWQKSGPWNSLGNVIFRSPNTDNIYLHDSPERNLFHKEMRAFSYGCVRVERALDLAYYILNKSDDYNKREVNNIIAERKETLIELSEPIPFYVLYLTAQFDEKNDKIQLRKDIYHRDEEMIDKFI